MSTAAKIMVVDDENRICQNVEKILAKGDYQIVKAQSAQEALEKLAKDSFSLLISDIVMPGMNGLELLRLVKENWPLTKAVMMTAYASTDTAVRAIRLGALDYVSKPFTPDELRETVDKALSGDLKEVETSPEERKRVPIDVDVPFDRNEVAEAVGEQYADMYGPSDMPVVEVKLPENYCETGQMVCDIFKKLGATCKAGTKSGKCPQLAKKAKKKTQKAGGFDAKTLVGIDQPFNYEEVVSVTGPEYVRNMDTDGYAFLPYEELKKRMAQTFPDRSVIDVDIPFDREEVARATGESYADHLSRSDMPEVEITAKGDVEGFCTTGQMVCEIFKKLGATCKAGTKSGNCPQLAKKKKAKGAKKPAGFDAAKYIAVDMPFEYREVAKITGPDYVEHLVYDGTVQVPYEAVKAQWEKIQAAEKQAAAAPQEASGGRIPILVIDDEVAVNNNIRKILAKKGFAVDQATSKNEALERMKSGDYRLILLDLKMPGVQGLELLEAASKQQRQARVIIITGYASIETAVESARMGAVAYLPKPFTPDEIRSATDEALQMQMAA